MPSPSTDSSQRSRDTELATLKALARFSHRHACAARLQTAFRAMAHKGVVQKLERRVAVEAAAAWERESNALAALREAKEELRPWPGRLEEREKGNIPSVMKGRCASHQGFVPRFVPLHLQDKNVCTWNHIPVRLMLCFSTLLTETFAFIK